MRAMTRRCSVIRMPLAVHSASAWSGEAPQMMIEQLAAQSFAAAGRGDGDREDFRLARDEAGENERDDAVRDSGAMGNNVAIEQELLEFALAPASTKRRGMEHGKGTGIARSGF